MCPSLILTPPTEAGSPRLPLFPPVPAAVSFQHHSNDSKASCPPHRLRLWCFSTAGALGFAFDPPALLMFPSSMSAPQGTAFSVLSKLLFELSVGFLEEESVRGRRRFSFCNPHGSHTVPPACTWPSPLCQLLYLNFYLLHLL